MQFSHFDCIGFKIDSEDDIIKMIDDIMVSMKSYDEEYKKFKFLLYEDNGIRLVINLFKNKIYSLNPHFEGLSRNKLSVTKLIVNKAGDGIVKCWIEPEDDLHSGLAPILFLQQEYFLHEKKKMPYIGNVQVTAFVEDFIIFENEKQYEEEKKIQNVNIAGEIKDLSFATDFFIPIGMFYSKNEKKHEPLAQFAGVIKNVIIRKNKLTNIEFYHLTVKSMIDFDVVMPIIQGKKITKGQIIEGTFWLSGTII